MYIRYDTSAAGSCICSYNSPALDPICHSGSARRSKDALSYGSEYCIWLVADTINPLLVIIASLLSSTNIIPKHHKFRETPKLVLGFAATP